MVLLMRKYVGIFLCILATSFFRSISSSSSTCQREFKTFLHDLNSQCPFTTPFASPPIEVDGELFERALSLSRKNEYTAVLFYASWCPFSSEYYSKFSTLSSMFPQIKHLMVEQASTTPSTFSRYGIHSVPSLLIVNQTTIMRYYGRKNLQSLVNLYKRTTGLDPIVDMVVYASSNSKSDKKMFGDSLKETCLREPYLVLSTLFVLVRTFLYLYPEIISRLRALRVAYIPHLNLGIFGESRQLLGRMLHLIDVKRIWTKLKFCKIRNFLNGARNARVWASSLASVSLGETSSSRVFT